MKRTIILFTALAVLLGISVSADPATTKSDAVAVLTTTDSSRERIGKVEFTQSGEEVIVKVRLRGLKPKSVHGFHIHTYGDLTAVDGTSAGGHFSPDNNPHAGLQTKERHAGDLGNVYVDRNGFAIMKIVVDNISLEAGHKDSIIGRAVVLHAGADDKSSQPSGDAGPRMAVGVIGYANPEQKSKES